MKPKGSNHLISFIFLILLLNITPSGFSNEKINLHSVKNYILSCQKQNGAFGPYNMEYTDLAWTYPAVHTLKILGIDIPYADSCYINGGKAWIEKANWKNGPWYWSLHQKANLYKLMNIEDSLEEGFPKGKSFTLQFLPRESYIESRSYLSGNFFDMTSLWNLVEAISVMEGQINNPPEIRKYIVSRQAGNGGFDDMLGTRTAPENEKTHLIVTHDAVMVLRSLDISIPNRDKLVNWVQSCQDTDGGYRWSPDNLTYSNKPDVWYTWAAIKILKTLGEMPKESEACLRWLNSLQNADGGFGDRPGWSSRLYSTYYAVHAIEMLTSNLAKGIYEKQIPVNKKNTIPEGKYSIFQAHHKSPAGGTEMVDSVVAMGLNLIGVKTTEKEVASSNGMSRIVLNAREHAEKKGYKIEILDCPENYAHRLEWFSGMKGDHCSNILLPPNMSKKEWENYIQAYNEGLKGHSWNLFKIKVIKPMLEIGTLFYPELDYTMMNAYMVYDDGLDGKPGYNAVPAAHFGNYDWVRHFPYKERWLGQLPMIADGDAHGNISEWKHNLHSLRNIFIAKSYKYADYIDASLNGRSVCVILMPETNEVRYYGSEPAVEYLKSHLSDWKWW
ncbi:MAG: prenyltransferase/squalene oxidase repeat-containing protein [Bacteroidota bacterium]